MTFTREKIIISIGMPSFLNKVSGILDEHCVKGCEYMKTKVKTSTVIGTLFLILFAGFLCFAGYRVIAKSNELPGKLVSVATAAQNRFYTRKPMGRIQKVDYEVMKYGYLDEMNLKKMTALDAYYDNERMEEVRAVNDLTAMEEWSSGILAYEEAKAEQEEAAKKAIAEAKAAQAAADAARRAKVQAITMSIMHPNYIADGTTIYTGDSSDLGSGATASRGGAIGEKVIAETHGASLGLYTITAYCTCRVCCGIFSGYNRTASGTVPTSNRTVAVDTNVIPFGTKLVINGQVYVAEDRGGAIVGNHIDMFFYTHAEALRWGVRTMEVFYYE